MAIEIPKEIATAETPAAPEAAPVPTESQPEAAPAPAAEPAREPSSLPENEYDALLDGKPDPNANEYDLLLNQQAEAPKEALKASIYSARDSVPDQQARILQLSQEMKMPPEIVARNLSEYEKRAVVEGNDYDDLIANAPATAGWLMNPENAKLAHDDVKNLSYLEAR
jgi:hypothetical protein